MNVHQRKIALFVELLIFIFPPLMLIDGICSLGVRALCARVANVAISIVGLWGLLLGLLKIVFFPFPSPIAPSPLTNLRVFWVKTSKMEGWLMGCWAARRWLWFGGAKPLQKPPVLDPSTPNAQADKWGAAGLVPQKIINILGCRWM